MKRLRYLLLTIFLIPSIAFASDIKKDTIDVVIHQDGSASITETWEVPTQKDTYFSKDFFNAEGLEISNVKIVNKSGLEYKQVDKLDKSERKTYNIINHDKSKSINMVLDTYKDDTYTITYDLNGMIKHYKDGIYGIDFTFVGINYSMKISNIIITIKSEVPYMETNTALFGIGKDLVLNISDGGISMNTYTYDNKSVIRLFTKFTDISYEKVVEVDKTFEEVYDKAKNQNSYIIYVLNIISIQTIVIIIVIIIGVISVLVIIRILTKKKQDNDFNGIDTINNKEIPKYDEVAYYKDIPIYNLYKVGFLASYFKISRNRSDLVGGFLLKWIYDGMISAFPKDSKPFLRLNYDTTNEEYQLDKDLYSILKESSQHNIIDGTKLDRFASSHYLRVMTWFNMGVSNVITDEVNANNIKRVTKMGKVHIELQDQLLEEATKLLGIKKYLLNFNQVPRETELTESTYKYLLIYAEIFGIGSQVAEEILRKNPNNVYAQKLLELEKVRFLYKNFYAKAHDHYKQINKNNLSDISSYNEEIDNIIAKNNQ